MVEVVGDRMPYRILRGRLSDIVVLNLQARTEVKCAIIKDSSYVELQSVFINAVSTNKNVVKEILFQRWGGNIFSNNSWK